MCSESKVCLAQQIILPLSPTIWPKVDAWQVDIRKYISFLPQCFPDSHFHLEPFLIWKCFLGLNFVLITSQLLGQSFFWAYRHMVTEAGTDINFKFYS